jgi:hypothetical protein
MSSISNAQQAMGWRALAAQPRDVLAASVADGAVEIERLQRENAELREDVIGWTRMAIERQAKIATAKAELLVQIVTEANQRLTDKRFSLEMFRNWLIKRHDAAIDAAREATK